MSEGPQNQDRANEAPEKQALRFKQEEDALQDFLEKKETSDAVASSLIDELSRKHAYEMAHGLILTMPEFHELESRSQALPDEESPSAEGQSQGEDGVAEGPIMTGEELVGLIDTPEFATHSRKDIETILDREGVPEGDIATRIAMLKRRVALVSALLAPPPEEIDEEAKQVEPPSRIEEVASDVPEPSAPVEQEASQEEREALVGELNSIKDKIDQRVDIMRVYNADQRDGVKIEFRKYTEGEYRNAKHESDELRTRAKDLAFEIAGTDRLLASVKIPDPRVIDEYEHAVRAESRKERKEKERKLAKDEAGARLQKAFYEARDRKRDFLQALTDTGVRKDVAHALYDEFLARAFELEKFSKTLGETAPAITGGRNYHLLKWHGITEGLSWGETRAEIDALVERYNTIPLHEETESTSLPQKLESSPDVVPGVTPNAPRGVLSGVYELRDDGHVYNASDASDASHLNTDNFIPSNADLQKRESTLSTAGVKKAPGTLYSASAGVTTHDRANSPEKILQHEALRSIRHAPRIERVRHDPVEYYKDPASTGLYNIGDDGAVRTGTIVGEGEKVVAGNDATKGEKYDELIINGDWETLDELLASPDRELAARAQAEWNRRDEEALQYSRRRDVNKSYALTETLRTIREGFGNTVPVRWLREWSEVPSVARYLREHPLPLEQAAPIVKQESPFEHATRLRAEKQGEKMQRKIGELAERANVARFSNSQLEDMEEDGVFDPRQSELSDIEIARAEKRKEELLLLDVAKLFRKQNTWAWKDLKNELGVSKKTLDRAIETILDRGLIAITEPGVFVSKSIADDAPEVVGETPPSSPETQIEAPKKLEKVEVPKKPEAAAAPELSTEEKYELDKEGSLWVSFIEREYGLDIDGKETGRTALPVDAPAAKRSAMAPVKTESVATTDEGDAAGKKIDLRAISPIVAEQFKMTFGIEENKLASIPEFAALSEGQQLLVRYQLLNETVSGIEGKALKMHRDKFTALTPELNKVEKWAVNRKGIFGGIAKVAVGLAQFRHKGTWQKMGMGIMKKKLTKDTEKQLREDVASGKIDQSEYISELSRQAKEGPDAEFKDGKLTLTFLKKEDLPGGLTPEESTVIDRFNAISAQFGTLPHRLIEQGASEEERSQYQVESAKYREALSLVLPILESKGNAESALLDANELDRRVMFTQFYNTHSSAAEQLADIKNTSSWWEFAKDMAAQRGASFALGYSVRSAAAFTASQVLTAGSMFIAAPLGGAAVGGLMGGWRANTELRERETLAKLGVKDNSAEKNNIVDATSPKKDGVPQGRDISLSGRLEGVLSDIKDTKEDEVVTTKIGVRDAVRSRRAQLLEKLELYIAFAEDKLHDGKVNYGEGVERIKNQYALLGALREAKATVLLEKAKKITEEIKDPVSAKKIERNWRSDKRAAAERLTAIIDSNDARISLAKNAYIRSTKQRAALYGAAFGFGGALVADIVHGATTPGRSVAMNTWERTREGVPDISKMIPKYGPEKIAGDKMVNPDEALVKIPPAASSPDASSSAGKAEVPDVSPKSEPMNAPTPKVATEVASGAAEFASYATEQKIAYGRELTSSELRALWATDQSPAHMTPGYFDTVHGKVHNALVVAIADKHAPLTEEEIKAIYKKFGYEEAMGRKIPEGAALRKIEEVLPAAPKAAAIPSSPSGDTRNWQKLHNPLTSGDPAVTPNDPTPKETDTPTPKGRSEPSVPPPVETKPQPIESPRSSIEPKPLPDLPDLPPPPGSFQKSSFTGTPDTSRSGFMKTGAEYYTPRPEQNAFIDQSLREAVERIRVEHHIDVDRTALETIAEWKENDKLKFYQPIPYLLERGHVPERGETLGDFYVRASKLEILKVKTPPPPAPMEHPAPIVRAPKNIVTPPGVVEEQPTNPPPRLVEKVVKQPEGRVVQQPQEIPPPKGVPRPELPVNKVIAGKWASVASNGVFENRYWQSVRDTSVARLMNGSQMPLSPDELKMQTLESAQWQMRNSIQKSYAMGFRAMVNETGGAYLDRVARELGQPLSNEQINYRAHNIYEQLTGKEITTRGNLNDSYTAARFLSERVLPGMNSTGAGQEFLQVQKVLLRIRENTGVLPVGGESVRAYAERAIRLKLEQTPTLHADMLLTEKKLTPPTIPVESTPPARIFGPPVDLGRGRPLVEQFSDRPVNEAFSAIRKTGMESSNLTQLIRLGYIPQDSETLREYYQRAFTDLGSRWVESNAEIPFNRSEIARVLGVLEADLDKKLGIKK